MSILSWENEYRKKDDKLLWTGLKHSNLHKHEVKVVDGVMYGMAKSSHSYIAQHKTLFEDFQGVKLGANLHHTEKLQTAYKIWFSTGDAEPMLHEISRTVSFYSTVVKFINKLREN